MPSVNCRPPKPTLRPLLQERFPRRNLRLCLQMCTPVPSSALLPRTLPLRLIRTILTFQLPPSRLILGRLLQPHNNNTPLMPNPLFQVHPYILDQDRALFPLRFPWPPRVHKYRHPWSRIMLAWRLNITQLVQLHPMSILTIQHPEPMLL
jgi:hypothetical protein